MSDKESLKTRIKRVSGLIYITIMDIIIFFILLKINAFNYINLKVFTSSFIEIIGVLLGLTFTSYAILLGIIKSITYSIRKTNGFGIIGHILFLSVIVEIMALVTGLTLLTIKNITHFEINVLGVIFILFSLIIISYVILMVYYMTLIFNSIRIEK